MDPNTQPPQQPPMQPPQPEVVQPQPVQQPSMPVPPQQPVASVGEVKKESHALVTILIIVLIIAMIAISGLFFYRQFTQSSAETTTGAQPKDFLPTSTPKIAIPTTAPQTDEQKEAEAVQIGDIDKNMKAIEADVNGL